MSFVSVIMPCYNSSRYLSASIEGVLAQTYRNLELIIVDDASTDGSLEIAREWQQLDDRITIQTHKENRGLAATRNTAIHASTGEYIAFCDSDDIWFPNKLEAQLAEFVRIPSAGLVHSDALIMDSNGQTSGQLFSQFIGRGKHAGETGSLLERLCRRNDLCVPTVMVRRQALDHVNGFNEELRSLEDWVCWTKIAAAFPFHFIPNPLAKYRVHNGALSSNKQNMSRNRITALKILFNEAFPISRQTRAVMFYALGSSYLDIRNSRQAAHAFAKSIAESPLDVRTWVRYGTSLLQCVTSSTDN